MTATLVPPEPTEPDLRPEPAVGPARRPILSETATPPTAHLVLGSLWHARRAPVHHEFTYPAFALRVNLDALPRLDSDIRGFGYNRWRPVALHDRDYLTHRTGSIRDRFLACLREAGLARTPASVILVTMPRVLGYAFNPVNFYYAVGQEGETLAFAAEVNNTFGDGHLYLLTEPQPDAPDGMLAYRTGKAFHVSPFNDLKGEYRFTVSPPDADLLDIRIDLVRDGQTVLQAQLRGEARELTADSLRSVGLRYPLSVALTMPRILAQAARLRLRHRLPVVPRPHPEHPDTFRIRPATRADRWAAAAVTRVLARSGKDRLDLRLPGGETRSFGPGPAEPTPARMEVRDLRAFRRMALKSDIGLGEGYQAGEWTSDDLVRLFAFFIRNDRETETRKALLAQVGRLADRARHLLRANTRRGSRENIQAHYDLSNAFFSAWLDPSMCYSSGIFEHPDEDLTTAQIRKLDRIIELADLREGQEVLEIGCGWGAFAIRAAQTRGVRVTGVTLSREQLAWARDQVREAGLEDRIDLRLQDYRDLTGTFDRIVSIEMLEAVGHRHHAAWFRQCDRLLRSDGRMAIQVIAIPDQRYDAYRLHTDWIQRHVFPGGLLPSLARITSVMSRHSRLVVDRLDNIGPDYAITLRRWRENFLAAWDRIEPLGFDLRFRRTWEYYLAYCEAAFAAHYLQNLQIAFRRPHQE